MLAACLSLAGCTSQPGLTSDNAARDTLTVSPAKDGPSSQVLSNALARAAALKAATGRPVSIQLRGGTYFLDAPVVLRPEHSGVSLVAYRNEKPVLSGGRRITGWREMREGAQTVWMADVPEARDGGWFFRQLWVNGERRTRARHPNRGYLAIAEVPDAKPDMPWHQGVTSFTFKAG
ncbi:MAG: hypothetical protein N3I86_11765, partial [Verrucomicrobiae bacterium]|nr:hypothetical protein [Verrucomicrobiae bacterium]